MRIYLAGGVSANLAPIWREEVKIYLAGAESRAWVVNECLSGFKHDLAIRGQWNRGGILSIAEHVNILESFFYAEDLLTQLIPHIKNFMLDSGAFTFMTQGKQCDFNEYVSRYIEYIRENNVDLFFELDIDGIIGYDKVKEIRKRLERETSKRPIPVWHKRLGKDEFLRMCDEYDYVAIGGIVSKEITKKEYKFFPWFIREAHKRGAKIHGLGFTNLEGLRIYHFDSVDSSAWTAGNRFGKIYTFDGKKLYFTDKPQGTRVKNIETAKRNFIEWVKFARYAEKNL